MCAKRWPHCARRRWRGQSLCFIPENALLTASRVAPAAELSIVAGQFADEYNRDDRIQLTREPKGEAMKRFATAAGFASIVLVLQQQFEGRPFVLMSPAFSVRLLRGLVANQMVLHDADSVGDGNRRSRQGAF